ncbi:SAM-dependent methyltransferase [Streptomyces avicenniae]|uniref:SAM-dependent methyltransferase n=1 Tax=Streptomyces avicenniae TaxID=500153 RepID=UPI00069B304A|nr:class I SAM-dependent methyltransferase [Streptomyces avicenniae]
MFSVSKPELDPAAWVHGPVADIFSSYIAATALSAAHELGLLDRLADKGQAQLDGDDGWSDRLHGDAVRAIYRTLGWAGVTEIKNGEVVVPGPRFEEAYAARGYFYWLVRGCGELFSVAPHVSVESNRSGSFYQRDMRAVALGSRIIGDTEVEPLFDALLAGKPARKVVDLGCGSGQRLIRIARAHSETECIGIDVSPAAVDTAAAAVSEQGLDGRIVIRQGDARELAPEPAFADVDTVTCVFMGHDLWPQEECVRALRGLREAFPRVERLLLCDVVRTTEAPGSDTAIFTLGFEMAHALMGVYLPSLDEWEDAFAEAGWVCETVRPTTTPPNGFLFQLRPASVVEDPR